MGSTLLNTSVQYQRDAQASGSHGSAAKFAPRSLACASRWYWRARALRHRSAVQGLSLIELIVVILVMGLLSAASLPRFADSLRQYRVSAAADRIIADLVRAQSAAYGSSTSKTITFNVPASSYEIAGVKPLDHPSGPYVVKLSEDPYQAALVSVWDQGGMQTITFDGYGLPDKGGTIVVACGGAQKAISVSATTGTAVIP